MPLAGRGVLAMPAGVRAGACLRPTAAVAFVWQSKYYVATLKYN